MHTIETFDDPKAFRAASEAFLLEKEAVNNLILGLSSGRRPAIVTGITARCNT